MGSGCSSCTDSKTVSAQDLAAEENGQQNAKENNGFSPTSSPIGNVDKHSDVTLRQKTDGHVNEPVDSELVEHAKRLSNRLSCLVVPLTASISACASEAIEEEEKIPSTEEISSAISKAVSGGVYLFINELKANFSVKWTKI